MVGMQCHVALPKQPYKALHTFSFRVLAVKFVSRLYSKPEKGLFALAILGGGRHIVCRLYFKPEKCFKKLQRTICEAAATLILKAKSQFY